MLRFLTARLTQAAIVLILMSAAVYGMIGLMPGDPIDEMIASNPQLTAADAERLRAVYGLDRPLVERYLAWLSAAAQGDFGYSRTEARPVTEVLIPRLGNTLILMGASMALALAIALPLGVYAASRPGSPADNIVNLLCYAGISMPTFWLALLLMIVFAVWLGWLPAGGLATPGEGDAVDRLRHAVLPVVTLAIASVGTYTRYVRAAMIEQLRLDYIRTARAKGAGSARIHWHHALRNAALPVVTIVGLDVGLLFSGALVVETMFGYLGMGKLIYDSIFGNDFNLALVGLLFATTMTLVGNLIADVVYAGLDPRVGFAGVRV